MSLSLSNSAGFMASSMPDGTIWIYGEGVNIEIKPDEFCNLIEGFLYLPFPSAVGIQSACESEVELQEVNLTLSDYFCLVQYFFTNTDIQRDDPRLKVINKIVISDHILNDKSNKYQIEMFNWLGLLEMHPGWNDMFYPQANIKRLG
jgi:hypothetical protein